MTQPEASTLTAKAVAEEDVKESDFGNTTHPTILAYFETLNQADFAATAALFAIDGQLLPPFEAPIIGREAIATYLEAEAEGMKATPQTSQQEELASGESSIQVLGQVQTSLFSINVSWQFLLNDESKILSVKIKLLAALRDLLHLKR